MKEKELVKKWLVNELNQEELEAFKQLDAYDSYIKLSESAKKFKAPSFDSDASLNNLKVKISEKQASPKNSFIKYATRIAAVFAISFGVYFAFFNNPYTVFETQTAESKTITLPDDSQVTLNAKTQLKFKAKNWISDRTLKLDGEAFFKVAKGQTFEVQTSHGKVRVLGTEFNVKSRKDLFEVNCYEGEVRVDHLNSSLNLPALNSYKYHNGKVIHEEMLFKLPSWMENKSTFKSVSFKHVLDEFQRQYNITFSLKNINTNQLFTGSFIHNDIDNALQSITLPLQLSYQKQNGTVILATSE
ncbi:MAG: FecR family protein [Flavobacteriaceae bacterium]